jgi:hypothetical protein
MVLRDRSKRKRGEEPFTGFRSASRSLGRWPAALPKHSFAAQSPLEDPRSEEMTVHQPVSHRVVIASLLVAVSGIVSDACARRREGTPANPAQAPAAEFVRGTIGDTVRMVVNHVRPDKRDEFEHFMRDILHPAMDTLALTDQETAKHIRRARLLRPWKMDADSTYPYIFLVDPVATTTPFDFSRALARRYSADQVAAYMAMFRGTLARRSDSYTFVNAEW